MTDLDRYLDDFGERLHGTEPPPRRRGLALGAAAAVATAVVVAVLLTAPGGGARPVDAFAAARAALDPQNEIVHMRIRYEVGRRATTNTSEQWAAQSPPRWRMVRWSPDGKQRVELSFAAGIHSSFASATNRLHIDDVSDRAPQARTPGIIGEEGADPQTDLRAMLASGKLRDAGEIDAGGRTVRRLVSVITEHGRPARTLTYDVDPVTFAPIQGSIVWFAKNGRRAAPPFRFTVERYERLPITAESEKLLAITPNADTTVIRRTDADRRRLREAMREWRAQCVTRKNGRLKCPSPPPHLERITG